ncbi:MAG: hypothetical protein NTZ95_04495, partial [Candidatus Omnitrophica bacterium]|nr:hypothetical protein [Candidatus Omnitrophota bacterium]
STADFMRQGLFSEGANNGLSLGPENLKDSIASSDTFGPEHLATGQLTDILYQNIGGANTGTIAPSSVFLNGSENRGDIMFALANILKNPTEDQKLILDAVESLLNDMKNLEEKAGTNPELNKAESDLLQMVASVLLAQGVPDLLKEGDIEGVKGIFRDLGASKDKIMLDYAQSITSL